LKNSTKIDNKTVSISPSIIAADLTRMSEIVSGMDPEIIDLVHMDVMDGNFVPNITFGPAYIKDLSQHTRIPLDVHLMIEEPEKSIQSYIDLKPWCITIHYESTRFPARLLSLIKEHNIIAGLSINPATPIETTFDLLPYADMILIMSVDPGFYGQKFMKTALGRIERLQAHSRKHFPELLIQVDGGINADNIAPVVQAGARIIVAGGAAFKNGDVNTNVQELKNKAPIL
jgi:ribulose-phosphate 3-epimerase